MTRPWHTSLRARLFLNLLPLAGMFLATGICAISLFSRLAHRVEASVRENYRSIIAAQAIEGLLVDWVRIRPAGPAKSPGDTNALAAYSRQFEENLALLAKPRPLDATEYVPVKATLEAGPELLSSESSRPLVKCPAPSA